MGFKATGPQLQIVESVLANRITNVQAGHAVGKTHLAAALVLWWVFCRQSMAITTAPTNRQVKELLWGEIRRFYDAHRDRLGGHRLEMSVKLDESAYAIGFTASSHSVDSFQGIHSQRAVLVIEDEANGISGQIDDGAIACSTGYSDRLLRIGNPVTKGTPFYKHCCQGSIRLDVFSHPNVSPYYRRDPTDGVYRLIAPYNPPYDYLIPGAISVEWIESVRQDKGETSPYWISRVCANFPESSSASVIPSHLWEDAIAAYRVPSLKSTTAPQHLRYGVDVGGGQDDHALAAWLDATLVHCEVQSSSMMSTIEWANYIAATVAHPYSPIYVDRVGVGLGTLDQLSHNPAMTGVVGVSNGDPSPSPEYKNLVTYAAWTLRLAMQKGEVTVDPELPGLDLIIEEFEATDYVLESDKRIALESKAKTKAKLGRSPDRRDAILMAWVAPTNRTGHVVERLAGMDLYRNHTPW